MTKRSLSAGLTVAAAALLGPLTMVQEPALAAAATRQPYAAQRTAPTDPVNLHAWLYPDPSNNVLPRSTWECFDITGAPSPRFICAQLYAAPARSWTPQQQPTYRAAVHRPGQLAGVAVPSPEQQRLVARRVGVLQPDRGLKFPVHLFPTVRTSGTVMDPFELEGAEENNPARNACVCRASRRSG